MCFCYLSHNHRRHGHFVIYLENGRNLLEIIAEALPTTSKYQTQIVTNDYTQLITSAMEVMFSLTVVCCLFVSSRITQKENYSFDFHKIQWKGGTPGKEETIRFW